MGAPSIAAPVAPPPPPNPATLASDQVQQSGASAATAAAAAAGAGFDNTIGTSPQGAAAPSTAMQGLKPLLGG